MRLDSQGFFWNDNEGKRTEPEATWLKDDYLPGLTEAEKFDIPVLNDNELILLASEYAKTGKKHKLIFDIECYKNLFFIAFLSTGTNKVIFFEKSVYKKLNIKKLKWVFDNFTVIGFNSLNYDVHIAAMALDGRSTEKMKETTTEIIEHGAYGKQILKRLRVTPIACDHIDIANVAPLFASLKIYGGRLHTNKLQDLPFSPEKVLSEDQIKIVRRYCTNDLKITQELYLSLSKDFELREQMSKKYKINLLSKSNAQIAESIISKQTINRRLDIDINAECGKTYFYSSPEYLKFKTEKLQNLFFKIKNIPFVVSNQGNIKLPDDLQKTNITIGNNSYSLKIGGLHSKEKSISTIPAKDEYLIELDVVSYYPTIILNLGIFPQALGEKFLCVFNNLVRERIDAKNKISVNPDYKIIADSLKIVINGTYGKFGSPFSILYSPYNLIKITLTGQLLLLMLIEQIELAGISVISSNTDSVFIQCKKNKKSLLDSIISNWQVKTNFSIEENYYKILLSRDVNNYMAVKYSNETKNKGIFKTPGLEKNPQNEICIDAIKNLIINGTPISKTIRGCKSVTKFLNLRTVNGGGVYLSDGKQKYIGKSVRWYYAAGSDGLIVYVHNGNKVPRTEGSKLLQVLPEQLPNDINYRWYEKETEAILKNIGFYEL